MKTLTPFLSSAILLLSNTAEARILRVNGNPQFATTGNFCYPSLEAAHSAANNGTEPTLVDTIHLEGYDGVYAENLTITKRVVIIGPGFLHNNNNPTHNHGLQYSAKTANVRRINLDNGSGGTIIEGVRFAQSGNSPYGVVILNTNNVTIKRCWFSGNTRITFGLTNNAATTATNITIAENFFENSGVVTTSSPNTITNLTIRNNYFGGTIGLNGSNDTFSSIVIMNNTLNASGTHGIRNATFTKNVLYQGTISDNNNTVMDNLATVVLPGDPGTIQVNMGNVYDLSIGTFDGKWHISETSQFSIGGVDQYGMYSGDHPYVLSGIPAIPTIFSLSSTVTTHPGDDTIDLTIGTKSNN